jgi:hypothetical protein
MRSIPAPERGHDEVVALLRARVAAVAEDQLARLLLPYPPESYHRLLLHLDEQVEVVAARWRSGGVSVLHGHSGSAALYHVVSGVLEEERYFREGDAYRYERVVLRAGDQAVLPPGALHQVHALEEAVTVHAYAPPPASAIEPPAPAVRRLCMLARRAARRPEAGDGRAAA